MAILRDVGRVREQFGKRAQLRADLLESQCTEYAQRRDNILTALCAQLQTREPPGDHKSPTWGFPEETLLGEQAEQALQELVAWLMEKDPEGGYATL